MSARRPNLFEQLVRPLLREPGGTLTIAWDAGCARAEYHVDGLAAPVVTVLAMRPPAGPGDANQLGLFETPKASRAPVTPALVRLACAEGIEAVVDDVVEGGGLDWSLADEGLVVHWWNEGSGRGAECGVAHVDVATADAIERERPVLTFTRRPVDDGDGPSVLRAGTVLYDSNVVRPAEAIESERYVVEAVTDDGVVARGVRPGLSPVRLLRAEIEHVAGRHASDGVTPAFWRRSPPPKARARRAPRSPRKAPPAAPVTFAPGQRVRVRAGMAGIDGVPVTLAGEVVTVVAVGPKRVKVRPDGRGKTYAVPPRALEHVDEGGAS